MADALPSLAFLGAGSMGGAILRGVLASGVPVDGGITATNRTPEKAEAFAGLDGVTGIAVPPRIDGEPPAAVAVVHFKLPEPLDSVVEALHDAAERIAQSYR